MHHGVRNIRYSLSGFFRSPETRSRDRGQGFPAPYAIDGDEIGFFWITLDEVLIQCEVQWTPMCSRTQEEIALPVDACDASDESGLFTTGIGKFAIKKNG